MDRTDAIKEHANHLFAVNFWNNEAIINMWVDYAHEIYESRYEIAEDHLQTDTLEMIGGYAYAKNRLADELKERLEMVATDEVGHVEPFPRNVPPHLFSDLLNRMIGCIDYDEFAEQIMEYAGIEPDETEA